MSGLTWAMYSDKMANPVHWLWECARTMFLAQLGHLHKNCILIVPQSGSCSALPWPRGECMNIPNCSPIVMLYQLSCPDVCHDFLLILIELSKISYTVTYWLQRIIFWTCSLFLASCSFTVVQQNIVLIHNSNNTETTADIQCAHNIVEASVQIPVSYSHELQIVQTCM